MEESDLARGDRIQCRLSEFESDRFEEIRQIIVFEKQSGKHLTPHHFYAKEDKVTDADVVRYLINNFKYQD
jgi:hypothetical protein